MANAYTGLVEIIRSQGRAAGTPSIQLAIMTGARSCSIGDLLLADEDLYIPDRLLTQVCTKVNIPESHVDGSSYNTPLKAGDIVAIFRLSDTKYVILDRVVSG